MVMVTLREFSFTMILEKGLRISYEKLTITKQVSYYYDSTAIRPRCYDLCYDRRPTRARGCCIEA